MHGMEERGESDGEVGRGMRERKRGTAGKFLEIVVVGCAGDIQVRR